MTVPPNKVRMSAEQRRASIVEAAIDLFSQRGFKGATTRELAANLGVTEPVLYQHFETKGALYRAILEAKAENKECVTPALERFTAEGDTRSFFLTLARALLDWYLEDPRYARMLMFSRLEEHELSDLFYQSRVAVFYSWVTTHLEAMMDRGLIRKMNPLLAARIFGGMVAHQGLVYAIYAPGDLPAPKEEIVETVVSIFLSGVLTKCPD